MKNAGLVSFHRMGMPAGKKIEAAVNDVVVVAVEGVEQVLLRTKALFRQALESVNPGFPFVSCPPQNASIETLKASVGALNFCRYNKGNPRSGPMNSAKDVVPPSFSDSV